MKKDNILPNISSTKLSIIRKYNHKELKGGSIDVVSLIMSPRIEMSIMSPRFEEEHNSSVRVSNNSV